VYRIPLFLTLELGPTAAVALTNFCCLGVVIPLRSLPRIFGVCFCCILGRRRGDSALCFTGGELMVSNACEGPVLRGELGVSWASEFGLIPSRFSVPSDDELRLSERATLWLLTRRMNCALL
jgi:hypothetical protein